MVFVMAGAYPFAVIQSHLEDILSGWRLVAVC